MRWWSPGTIWNGNILVKALMHSMDNCQYFIYMNNNNYWVNTYGAQE